MRAPAATALIALMAATGNTVAADEMQRIYRFDTAPDRAPAHRVQGR